MHAFVRLASGSLVKVYDHGSDWQVLVTGERGGKEAEWWFSTWPHDREASFCRAIAAACERLGQPNPGDIVRTAEAA